MGFGSPILLTGPAALPVSLAEFKAQLRYDETIEDALLMGYLHAATEACEQYTGMSFITSTWSQTFSAFDSPMKLWRRPLQTVVSISYLDSANAPQLLDSAVYRVIGVASDLAGGSVRLVQGQVWPSTYADEEAVTIEYRAGFGDTHNDVPELIRHAILMAAATFFGFREDLVMGSTVAELPFNSKNLLRSWRQLAVA